VTNTTRRLEGRRTIVTGAASGVGRATAVRFAAEGARVGLLDIDRDGLARTVEEINPVGEAHEILVADVADEDAVAAAIGHISERWQGLDVAVANAGIQLFGQDARAHELDKDVWDRTLAVNLTGVFLTCKHAIRRMLPSGGSVILTASPTSLYGLAPGFDAYSASKAGVLGLSRVMANDYAADGIRVNAVIPGFVDTPLVADRFADQTGLERRLAGIPLGRPGRPEEIASMMVFLASEESSYATGGIFTVDGGFTAI
jgi:NAD(P)-dependent dehydrogenase (short-subunit alcohol dehydrogenase family)